MTATQALSDTAYNRVLDTLREKGSVVTERGDSAAMAQCPAHDDRKPSLSIATRRNDDGVVLHCHAGCSVNDVVNALGWTLAELFDDPRLRQAFHASATYEYPDGRRVHRGPNKQFRQSGNMADRSLYHGDRVGDARTVYVVEGERDVQAAEAVGGVAVCSPMGAGKARRCDWSSLRNKAAVIVADDDPAGLKHAADVATILATVAESVRIVKAKSGNDLADHIAAGHGLEELIDVDDEPAEDTEYFASNFVTGGKFIFDLSEDSAPLWGDGTDVLWSPGESLMIAGPMGLGKTTFIGLLIREGLDLGTGELLGYTVAPWAGRALYLAMDRPRQAARALCRQFNVDDRTALDERLTVWQGPPPADIAKNPSLLLRLARAADATVVLLDSVKDGAIGLSEDEVGAGYNRARQLLLADGRELVENHHTVKRGPNGAPPTNVADIYGSAWITNGTGSIFLLSGEPNDPIVGFRHVRAPIDEVGPFQLLHDHTAGTLTVHNGTDLVALVIATGVHGLTARDAAIALNETSKPSAAQKERARRKLDKLVAAGLLTVHDGMVNGTPTSVYLPNDVAVIR